MKRKIKYKILKIIKEINMWMWTVVLRLSGPLYLEGKISQLLFKLFEKNKKQFPFFSTLIRLVFFPIYFPFDFIIYKIKEYKRLKKDKRYILVATPIDDVLTKIELKEEK